MLRPKRPTPKMVNEYVQEFEAEEYVADRALSKLFATFPANDQRDDILLKVTALNSLYYTNIFAVGQVAEHIFGLKIDPKLKSHSLEVVNEIAVLSIKGKARRNYSFATKYCSWHAPETYPIYDSYVERLLWAYQSTDAFASFKRADMQDYPKYKNIIENFQEHYGLSEYGFKRLDEFLWLYGKECFRA